MGIFSCQAPNAHDSLPRKKRPAKYSSIADPSNIFSPQQLLEKPNFPSSNPLAIPSQDNFDLPRPRQPGALAPDSIGRVKKYEIDFSPTGGIGTIRRPAGRATHGAGGVRVKPNGPRPRPKSKNLGRSGTAKRIREMIGRPKDFVHKAHVGMGDLNGIKDLEPESFVAHYDEIQAKRTSPQVTPATADDLDRIPTSQSSPSAAPKVLPTVQQPTPPKSRPTSPAIATTASIDSSSPPLSTSPSILPPVTPSAKASNSSLPSSTPTSSSPKLAATTTTTPTRQKTSPGKRKAAPPVTASIIKQVGEVKAFSGYKPTSSPTSPVEAPVAATSQPLSPSSSSDVDSSSQPSQQEGPPTLPTKPTTPTPYKAVQAMSLFPPDQGQEHGQQVQGPVQYDAQGRPVVAVVGDVEMSKTVKKEWDGALEFIQNALKMEDERGEDGEFSVKELLERRQI